MEDFNALASSLAAGVVDVRGCLILSRDGLVIGAHPLDAEEQTKPAWLRFATMGDPERSFAQFGTETWCYVRRGPYAAFAVVGPSARPGLVIDHIEQVLLAAEKSRSMLEAPRAEPTAPPSAPSGKPRTPLHADRPADEPVMVSVDAPAVEPVSVDAPSIVEAPAAAPAAAGSATPWPAPDPPLTAPGAEPSEPTEEPAPEVAEPGGAPSTASVWGTSDEADEVDRFSLTREFGQLLQDDRSGADGYPTTDRRT